MARRETPAWLSAVECSAMVSALRHDQSADFRRIGKNNIGSVAHHAGCDQGGGTLLWTVVAAVGLEPEVSLPKDMRLAVGRGHAITVAAVADRLNAIIGVELLEIGNCRAAHHAERRC